MRQFTSTTTTVIIIGTYLFLTSFILVVSQHPVLSVQEEEEGIIIPQSSLASREETRNEQEAAATTTTTSTTTTEHQECEASAAERIIEDHERNIGKTTINDGSTSISDSLSQAYANDNNSDDNNNNNNDDGGVEEKKVNEEEETFLVIKAKEEKDHDKVHPIIQQQQNQQQLHEPPILPSTTIPTNIVDPYMGRQHLLLVSKNSPHRLLLTEEVTQKIRSLQQSPPSTTDTREHTIVEEDFGMKLLEQEWKHKRKRQKQQPQPRYSSTTNKNTNTKKEQQQQQQQQQQQNPYDSTRKSNNRKQQQQSFNTSSYNYNNNNNYYYYDDDNDDDDDNDNDHHRHRRHHLTNIPLELRSHPGMAIVPLSDTFITSSYMVLDMSDYIELGIGPLDQALSISSFFIRHSNAFQRGIDGASMVLGTGGGSSSIEEGSFVLLTSIDNNGIISSLKTGTETTPRKTRTSALPTQPPPSIAQFIVHKDGSISPKYSPHLVIGIFSYPKVALVPRDSNQRFIFEYSKELAYTASSSRTGTRSSSIYSTNTEQQGSDGDGRGNDGGINLILKSHPNLAIVPALEEPYNYHNMMRIRELGVGPKENAIQLSFQYVPNNNEFSNTNGKDDEEGSMYLLKCPTTGFILLPFDRKLINGNRMVMTKYEMNNFWITALSTSDPVSNFTLNEEGSISPYDAPHLALGSTNLPGLVDHIITKEQMIIATQQAASQPQEQQQFSGDEFPVFAHVILRDIMNGDLAGLKLFGCCIALLFITIIKIIPWNGWFTLLGCLSFGVMPVIGLYALWRGLTMFIKYIRSLFWKRNNVDDRNNNNNVNNHAGRALHQNPR